MKTIRKRRVDAIQPFFFIENDIVFDEMYSCRRGISLDVVDRKQIKFRKLKMSLLFHGSLNTLRFF